MKTPRALMFALICGLVAAASLYFYISARENFWNEKYGNVDVLIANQDIEQYKVIDQTMLGTKSIPNDFAEPDALKTDQLGMVINYVAETTIKKGSQITLTKISSPGESRISILLDKESRACTVAVNEISGVAGLIRPGDHVDIIGTFKTLEEKSRLANQAHTTTIFQNIQVIAVGRNYMFETTPSTHKEKGILSSTGGSGFSNVTVAMTPRQCMDLTVAQQVGVLTVMLRSYQNRFGGKTYSELKDLHSTTATVTGIKGLLEISNRPKWLEIRGEQTSLVP